MTAKLLITSNTQYISTHMTACNAHTQMTNDIDAGEFCFVLFLYDYQVP